jgi:hypothetical protein
MRGLITGITERFGSLKSIANKVVNIVKLTAQSGWWIKSPSKLFHYYGTMLMKGLENGIDDGIAGVVVKLRDLVKEMKEAMLQVDKFNYLTFQDKGQKTSGKSGPGGGGFGTVPGATITAASVQPPPPPPDIVVGAWDRFFKRFELFKEGLPSFRESIMTNLGDAFMAIGDVFGQAVANWDGTLKGFFSSLAEGFRSLVQQILAELVRLMVIKAIMQIIGAVGGAAAGGGATGDHGGSHVGGGGNLMATAGTGGSNLMAGGAMAGSALMSSSTNNTSNVTNFAPVITIKGGANADETKRATLAVLQQASAQFFQTNRRNA